MIRISLIAAILAAVVAGSAGAALNAASPTPRQAASAAKACFAKNGWSAQLLDGGVTVAAQGPRKPSGQRRAWYSVVFRGGAGATSYSELALNLDSRERRTATLCRNAGWAVAPARRP